MDLPRHLEVRLVHGNFTESHCAAGFVPLSGAGGGAQGESALLGEGETGVDVSGDGLTGGEEGVGRVGGGGDKEEGDEEQEGGDEVHGE